MQLNKISILFYAKTCKANKNGEVPLYLQVTINGVRIKLSTSQLIDRTKCSIKDGRMKGTSEEAESINSYLDSMRFCIYETESFLVRSQAEITPQSFKSQFLGQTPKERMLTPIFRDHNKRMKELIGNE